MTGAFLSGLAVGGESITVEILEPAADRWMYSANSTPGSRGQASTFSALPGGGGDNDRFGQFIFSFDTVAAGIPAGRGADGYEITSLEVTARIAQNNLFLYDPTVDKWFTYGAGGSPDEDAGRPLELHGTGFRNGFSAMNFAENSAYSGGSPVMRNAYALGFDEGGLPRDVSDNVSDGYDGVSWAVGEIPGMTPRARVPIDSVVRFQIDLNLPGVREYVARGLNEGALWFTLSSLHPALQQAGEFVSYYTKESPEHQLFGDSAPTMEIEYAMVEEEEPVFTTFERDGSGVVSLTFEGQPGFVYELQVSGDMSPESWEEVDTFTPSAPGMMGWEGVRTEPRLFFRICRTPAMP